MYVKASSRITTKWEERGGVVRGEEKDGGGLALWRQGRMFASGQKEGKRRRGVKREGEGGVGVG